MATLSEVESKRLLRTAGIPFPDEKLGETVDGAVAAAAEIGYPIVMKLNGPNIAHKTERGLVRLRIANRSDAERAATELLAAATPEDGDVSLLLAPMLSTTREFIAGLTRDPQFGPCVLFGLGGVMTEAFGEVQLRPAPLTEADAAALLDEFPLPELLGSFRGEPAIDRSSLEALLVTLGAVAGDHRVVSVDLNPVLIDGGRAVAVDALVEITDAEPPPPARPGRPVADRLGALFDPRGIAVVGASTHPGKFGFVSLHNVLANRFEGPVVATNRERAEVLGIRTVASVAELDDGLPLDLAFICTPAPSNAEILRECADRGITAAFVTSAGYAEADAEGAARQEELITVAEEVGIVVAGPNGQGIVSTPSSLCAQIVAPYPPAGTIGVASQSGNLVSSFMNLANAAGIGISRAVSAGNAAMVGVIDYLEYFATDPSTTVGLAYVEGLADGRQFAERLRRITGRLPVVVVKGGATERGAEAAASHTGSLASDDRVFDGALRWAGAIRAVDPESAFDIAATFATQPLPTGNRVAVLTAAGGWGVVAADAIGRSSLELAALNDELRAAIDAHLPPRWSRSNPIDLAGGETRDTIPALLNLVAADDGIDAVIYLGMGIQANQAAMFRRGGFYPDHGLDRIVDYHERQDARFATAAAEASDRTGKPVLVASELAVSNPENPGVAAVRASGRVCYPSAGRAVAALDALWRHARR